MATSKNVNKVTETTVENVYNAFYTLTDEPDMFDVLDIREIHGKDAEGIAVRIMENGKVRDYLEIWDNSDKRTPFVTFRPTRGFLNGLFTNAQTVEMLKETTGVRYSTPKGITACRIKVTDEDVAEKLTSSICDMLTMWVTGEYKDVTPQEENVALLVG